MIIDVILAYALNFCEFDCLFKKVAYEVMKKEQLQVQNPRRR